MNNNHRVGKTDGRLFPITEEDIVRGAVFRMVHEDGSSSSFSDCIVVSERNAMFPESTVKLVRPYTHISRMGAVLTGMEEFEVSLESLLKPNCIFKAVIQSTGKVANTAYFTSSIF